MLDDPDTGALFDALANKTRRQMLDILKERPGIGVGTLASEFDVSRIAIMKHLQILENAELLVSEKVGRTRKLYFNAVPIQLIHERWTTEFSAYWSSNLISIKRAAEKRERDQQ